MRADVVESIIRLIALRSADLRYLGISWFGGEPLLAVDTIREISRRSVSLSARNGNLSYFADMTTNGYLLKRPLFEELVGLGIRRFQITLDGVGQDHDNKRMTAGGGGTFMRIWNNLQSFKSVKDDFSIMVRVHVSADNLASLIGLINLFAGVFAGDKRFKLFIRPLSRLGCPRDAELPVLDEEHSSPLIEKLVQQAKQLGINAITPSDILTICYASRLNSFAVRPDGSINKCTVKLDHPENQVGRINVDGSLHLDSTRLFKWARGLKSGDKSELLCPLTGI